MQDLTEQVAAIANSSAIKTGPMYVFNVGSTAALGTIEFEPGLQQDLPTILDKLIPPSRNYGHEQTWHDWERPLPSPGNAARPIIDGSHRRRQAHARDLAASLSSRMRRARASAHSGGHSGWRLRTDHRN
jgi:hypothetical protein